VPIAKTSGKTLAVAMVQRDWADRFGNLWESKTSKHRGTRETYMGESTLA